MKGLIRSLFKNSENCNFGFWYLRQVGNAKVTNERLDVKGEFQIHREKNDKGNLSNQYFGKSKNSKIETNKMGYRESTKIR